MLEIIDYHLKVNKLRSAIIKGDVIPKKRSALVDSFNSDPNGPEVSKNNRRLFLFGSAHFYIEIYNSVKTF